MGFSLPLEVISQADVTRMLRELNGLEDFFVQAKGRQPGSALQPPKLSLLLERIARDNNYNLLNETDRQKLTAELNQIISSAPLLHISFAAEPSAKALEKILEWMRANIHQQALLRVGLQPNIAAGCVLRTPNKVFDMSMRSYLKQQQPYMVELINAAAQRGEK